MRESIVKMCFDRRVLGGLAIAAAGILVLNPAWFGVALPVLAVAACPLSMLLMMRGMRSGDRSCAAPTDRDASPASASRQDLDEVAELRGEVRRLRAELASRDSSTVNRN
jgi:hypothetical protein